MELRFLTFGVATRVMSRVLYVGVATDVVLRFLAEYL